MPEDCRHQLYRVRAGEDRLDPVDRCGHAAGDGQRAPHLAMQRRQPLEAEKQFSARRQREVGHNRQPEDVDVGLIKAVEEHEAVGPGPIELARHAWPAVPQSSAHFSPGR